MLDLFADTPPWQEPLAPGAMILRRFAFLLFSHVPVRL